MASIRDKIARLIGRHRASPTAPTDGTPLAERRAMIGLAAAGAGTALWSLGERAGAQDARPSAPPAARIDIRTFGARGDRVTDDLDPIRKAIAQASRNDQYPASVFVPTGHYRRRGTIALPGHICLFGEGVSSILNSQGDREFDQPILTNQNPAGLIDARIQDLGLYGGSHALRLAAEQENADLRLQNVTMLLQGVANIEVNKLFQTVKLNNCVMGIAPYGIRVLGSGTNCMVATGCEWVNHSECSVFLRGADGVTIVGGRFEGGGAPGKYCLDIENASNILFLGCFFEGVHEFLGRFRQISGAVTFQSCHFTGTGWDRMAIQPFRWDPGDSMIVFRDCFSLKPMPVGGHVVLEGSNPGIIAADVLYQGAEQGGRITAQPRPLVGGRPVPAITLQAPDADGGWLVRGALTLLPAGETITMTIAPDTPDASVASNAFTVAAERRSAREWVLSLTPRAGGSAGWRFEWDCLTRRAAPMVRVPLT
jgi:hypothetical protein